MVLPWIFGGCATALNPKNLPSQFNPRIAPFSPPQYCLRIEDRECRVPADGRAVMEIPVLGHDCSIYLFGVCKIKDGLAQKLPGVQILRDGQCMRALTLRQVEQLSCDAEGCRLLKRP